MLEWFLTMTLVLGPGSIISSQCKYVQLKIRFTLPDWFIAGANAKELLPSGSGAKPHQSSAKKDCSWSWPWLYKNINQVEENIDLDPDPTSGCILESIVELEVEPEMKLFAVLLQFSWSLCTWCLLPSLYQLINDQEGDSLGMTCSLLGFHTSIEKTSQPH